MTCHLTLGRGTCDTRQKTLHRQPQRRMPTDSRTHVVATTTAMMDPTPPMGSLSYQFFPLEAYNDCTFNRATFLFSCVRPASPLTTEPRTVASPRTTSCPSSPLHSHPDTLSLSKFLCYSSFRCVRTLTFTFDTLGYHL
jgi:hypothetical protein